MDDFPWLTTLWVVPLVGAVVVLALPARMRSLAKTTALAVAAVVLVLACALAVGFDPAGEQYQFVESHEWIPALGTRYTLGVDGIALVLVLLTAVLLPLLMLAGWNDATQAESAATARGSAPRRTTQLYMALMLTVEAMVMVSFTALDVLLFYIFFEAMLIPMYFLIGGFGDRLGDRTQRSRAAVKFLLYNLFGGLIMLAAVIGLYVVTAGRAPAPSTSGTSSPP